MSIDFYFYEKLTLTDVINKTNIKVLERDGNTFLQDDDGNLIKVNRGVYMDEFGEVDYDTFELSSYGSNNPKNIIDELVEKLGLRFLIDDEEEYLCHNNIPDLDIYLNESMCKYGYKISK